MLKGKVIYINSIINIFLLFILLSCLEIITLLSVDINVINYELFTLSIILFYIITSILIIIKDYYTPIAFFSILFYGYVFSGIYFSFYDNFEYARFFNLVETEFSIQDFIYAQTSIMVGYIFFILGNLISSRIIVKEVNIEFNNFNLDSKIIRNSLIILFIIGFMYWLYISFKVANGPVDLLSKLGIFHAILKDGITTLPYLLSYIGSSLLFLYYLNKGYSIPFYIKIIILLTFLIMVSKARLSGAVFYLGGFFIMYAIFHNIKIDIKKVAYIFLFFCILIILYMMRYYSNLDYIGMESSEPILELLGRLFFGRTNVGDLQSIVFSYEYIKEQGYLFGLSFLDFTRFWIDRLLPINMEMSSIGIRLKQAYFEHVSGAPAPGIISEMIINFGIGGITLGMFLLGIIIELISKVLNPLKSKLNLFIYVKFLFFILILPKVDSTSIQGFIWAILPIAIFIISVVIINIFLKGIINKNNSLSISTSQI